MHQHLGAVSPHLRWEFGPGEGDGHRLVITPEYRHELRPLGEAVLSRAPTIPGWSFAGFRPAERRCNPSPPRAARTPRHSWLLFDDADLAEEWAGLRDDTPAQPEISAT